MDLIDVFRDTMEWIEENPTLSEAVENSKRKTAVYRENDYPEFDNSHTVSDTTIEVSKDRSFEAARRLSERYPDKRIAVLNFANAFKPGGGVERGARSQEESLCRISTLYPVINTPELKRHFYKYHRELGNSCATDSLIYSEDIIVCKSDTKCPEKLPLKEWLTLDVITMAAPDLRENFLDPENSMSDAELFGYHVKRAIHMFTVAASRGADILVLGAFGCGAFHNSPAVVASAYKTALSVFPKVFEHIEFAIYCSKAETDNYKEFNEKFGKCSVYE